MNGTVAAGGVAATNSSSSSSSAPQVTDMMTPVSSLPGCGVKYTTTLKLHGIVTLYDLLKHDYEKRPIIGVPPQVITDMWNIARHSVGQQVDSMRRAVYPDSGMILNFPHHSWNNLVLHTRARRGSGYRFLRCRVGALMVSRDYRVALHVQTSSGKSDTVSPLMLLAIHQEWMEGNYTVLSDIDDDELTMQEAVHHLVAGTAAAAAAAEAEVRHHVVQPSSNDDDTERMERARHERLVAKMRLEQQFIPTRTEIPKLEILDMGRYECVPACVLFSMEEANVMRELYTKYWIDRNRE